MSAAVSCFLGRRGKEEKTVSIDNGTERSLCVCARFSALIRKYRKQSLDWKEKPTVPSCVTASYRFLVFDGM